MTILSEQGMSPCKKPIGQRLRFMRLQMGVSQRQFAHALGTAPNHICQIERGRCVPGAKLLRGMREQFGIDINWLLSGAPADITTTPLGQEVHTLVRHYRRADLDARAMLLYTARFMAGESGTSGSSAATGASPAGG